MNKEAKEFFRQQNKQNNRLLRKQNFNFYFGLALLYVGILFFNLLVPYAGFLGSIASYLLYPLIYLYCVQIAKTTPFRNFTTFIILFIVASLAYCRGIIIATSLITQTTFLLTNLNFLIEIFKGSLFQIFWIAVATYTSVMGFNYPRWR